MRTLYITLLACMATLFSCNSKEQEKAEQPTTITDLQRDGLKGNIKTYTHREYKAIQQGSDWLPADSAMVHTEYSYDSTGTLVQATDIIINGQQVNTVRKYKHAPNQPLTIISYDMLQPTSHSIRTWHGLYNYTEKTFLNFDKEDTTDWQILKQVTLNNNHLPEKYTSILRAGSDTAYTSTAWIYYDAGNHVSKKVLHNSADSVVINYTLLQQDDKGNPLKTLKQNPTGNENILMADNYEYY